MNLFLFSVEGLKAVEIEKCKRDITDIKDQIWNAQKKFVDFNRMRYHYYLYLMFSIPVTSIEKNY